MATVTSYVPDLLNDPEVAEMATKLIAKVMATGKPDGVIWVEYFYNDGETLAQVHYLDARVADNIKEDNPTLTEAF